MRPLPILTACIAAATSLALAGCGGGAQDNGASVAAHITASPRATATITPRTPAKDAAAAATHTTASPATARTGATSAAGTAPPSHAGAPWFTAHVLPCVTPGGTQTLVGTTRPGYSVAFNTTYSDGRHGDTYGGTGIIAPGPSGAFHTSWQVSARTPLGSVHMLVGTGGHGGSPDVTEIVFSVASTC
jgi:hypothetical protein